MRGKFYWPTITICIYSKQKCIIQKMEHMFLLHCFWLVCCLCLRFLSSCPFAAFSLNTGRVGAKNNLFENFDLSLCVLCPSNLISHFFTLCYCSLWMLQEAAFVLMLLVMNVLYSVVWSGHM